MPLQAYFVTVADGPASVALGQPSHVFQVEAFAAASSVTAFARALIAARLAGGSERSVASFCRQYGGEVGSGPWADLAKASPGQVFVRALNARPGDEAMAWPPRQSAAEAQTASLDHPTSTLVVTGFEDLDDQALFVLHLIATSSGTPLDDVHHEAFGSMSMVQVRDALRALLEGGWIVLVDKGASMLRNLYASTPAARDALDLPHTRQRLYAIENGNLS